MKYFIAGIGILAILLFGSSCERCRQGIGKTTEKTIQLENFDEISIDIPGKIYIRQSNSYQVKVECNENLMSILDFEVSRKKLRLKSTNCIDGFTDLNVYVSVPNLEKITVNSDARLYTQSNFKIKDFKLEVNGAGTAKLDLNCKDLETELNGMAKIKYSGQCKKHEIEINGTGSVNTYKMITQELEIELNGSGTGKVSASEKLDISVNGVGTVYYAGKPEKLNTQINGLGTVKPEE